MKLVRAAKEALSSWSNDPDLTSVRDKQQLSNLPEEEQKAWKALWDDVNTELQK